ncbi:MAG TPA: hypothetical protein VHM19_14250 [Polyangiales bacterium]|jgi:hypothetical protein|nr:hypothetical protein [Polyangiales bacterium]
MKRAATVIWVGTVGCVCVLALASCTSSDDAAADGGSATAGNGAGAGSGGTGAGGASGNGSAGHAGNTAGSSGTDNDGGDWLDDGGAAPCSPCIGKTVGWGPNGGFVAYTDHSELTQCNEYHHKREPAGRGPMDPAIECERPVPCMGSGLHGIADVLQALQHPDVVAARKNAMVLYGYDSRPVDGTVFRIELPGSVIDVGGACQSSGGGGACTDIPAGVAALKALLESIDSEQLAIEPCLAKFSQ